VATLFFNMQDTAGFAVVPNAPVGSGELFVWLRQVACLGRI
jgi:hypothetical protein